MTATTEVTIKNVESTLISIDCLSIVFDDSLSCRVDSTNAKRIDSKSARDITTDGTGSKAESEPKNERQSTTHRSLLMSLLSPTR